MRTKSVSGYYGSNHTPCTVFVAESHEGNYWYCVEDSVNVNLTSEFVEDGIDVETLSDIDSFTFSTGIQSEEELAIAIES